MYVLINNSKNFDEIHEKNPKKTKRIIVIEQVYKQTNAINVLKGDAFGNFEFDCQNENGIILAQTYYIFLVGITRNYEGDIENKLQKDKKNVICFIQSGIYHITIHLYLI